MGFLSAVPVGAQPDILDQTKDFPGTLSINGTVVAQPAWYLMFGPVFNNWNRRHLVLVVLRKCMIYYRSHFSMLIKNGVFQ